MSFTARDLIKDSLVLIGAIAAGETPTSREANDGLNRLKGMLGTWSNKSLLIFSKAEEVFPISVNKQIYTMGVGGDFNTSRPQKIENANCRIINATSTVDLPIQLTNKDQWAAITVKGTQSPIVTRLYFEDIYPLANLHFWPIPTAGNSVVLYSWKPLTSIITSLDTVIDLRPGFDETLIYNLAIRLSPLYGKTPPPEVAAIATEALASLKQMNTKPEYLVCDDATLSTGKAWNYLTGESGD